MNIRSVGMGWRLGLLIITATASRSEEDGGVNGVRFEPITPVEIRLHGEATLQSWEMIGTEIEGYLETNLSADKIKAAWEAGQFKDFPEQEIDPQAVERTVRIQLRIPAGSLRGRYRRMQQNLLDAIKARDFPYIVYEFIELDGQPVPVPSDEKTIVEVKARGNLTLAGTTNIITHTSRVHFINFDHMELSGHLELNMRDFNVEPPVALLGLVRADPDFEVFYRFEARIQAPSQLR